MYIPMVYFCWFYRTSNIYVNLNKRIWHMSEKLRQQFHISFLTPSLQLHSMTRANLNKSKKKSLDFYYHSIKIHSKEAQHLYQLKSPLSDANLLCKSTSKLWNKIYFIKTVFETFMKWGLKGGISIDTDSWPLGYVLWASKERLNH